MQGIVRAFRHIDWVLLGALIPIFGFGLMTMNSFVDSNTFFDKQLIWVGVSLGVMVGISFIDFRFLRRTRVVMMLFLLAVVLLGLTYVLGETVNGSQRWINLGFFNFQPSDVVKLILIIVLAKYFSRRHIEIADSKHIIISGLYAFSLFALIFFQPDLGSALILFAIWLGMVLVAGISKKHLGIIFMLGAIVFAVLWTSVLAPYQKARIVSFLNPLEDIQGAGYNAYQSTVAVGSGGWFGKGVGYGTQSRLQFLPEYETDFIFAAFAEEWGFMGVLLLLILYGIIFWRMTKSAMYGATNFETLFCAGLSVFFLCHLTVHIGMNVGLLPVTGTTLPFMSYGGSHLLTESVGLGILFGMRRYARPAHRSSFKNEIIGI